MAETEEPSEGQTAILPKSILGGKEFKPGEEVMLKIVALHDNDVEVEYAPKKALRKAKKEQKKRWLRHLIRAELKAAKWPR